MNRRALLFAFRLGLRQAIVEHTSTGGHMILLIVLLVSYGALLPAIPATDLQRLGLTAPQMIWYLAITETVVMSISVWNFRQLQYAIRNGTVEVWLLRPIRFWPMLLAEWAGRDLPRFLPLGIVGIILGRVMSGTWEIGAGIIMMLIPTVIASAIIVLCCQFMVAMATVWMRESSPVFWLYQKFLFLLGGLMWPLTLYPVWLRKFAWFTPFPAILAAPGDLLLRPDMGAILNHSLCQIFWIVACLILCAFVSQAAQRRMTR